jgi:hypothetical protein
MVQQITKRVIAHQEINGPVRESCLVAIPFVCRSRRKKWNDDGNQWWQQRHEQRRRDNPPLRDSIYPLAHDRDQNYVDLYSSKLVGSPPCYPKLAQDRRKSCRPKKWQDEIDRGAAAAAHVVTVWTTVYWYRSVTTFFAIDALRAATALHSDALPLYLRR